jgi:hypothetical protein
MTPWIKMTDAKPKLRQRVLVYAGSPGADDIHTAYKMKSEVHFGERCHFEGEHHEIIFNVTHWMPLPERPVDAICGEGER